MVLTDTRIKNIILEEMILFQEELSLKTLNQELHFFIAKESGWEFPCYEYKNWYNNSLDYEGKQFYLKEFSRSTIEDSNPNAVLLLEQGRISGLRQSLTKLTTNSAKNSAKLGKVSRRMKSAKKGSKAYKNAKKEYDALVKQNRELAKEIKKIEKQIGKLRAKGQTQSTVSAKSNQALKDTDTLARGVNAEKTLRTAAKDLKVSDKVLRNPTYIKNNVAPAQRQSLLNALKDVKAADKLAKSKNMRITQKVKVKGKTQTVNLGAKGKGKDAFKGDVNQAAKHLGSTSKFKLDKKGRMKLSKEVQHLPPSLIRRVGSKTWDVLKKPGKTKAAVDMFKNLGRRAMDFVKRNPLKFAFLGIVGVPFALLGLYLYNHFKTPDMPDVPDEVADAVDNDSEGGGSPNPAPTPDVGPVTPATNTRRKCKINNKLLKDNPDLGPNLKAAYKELQSYLVAAGLASLMPKTLSNGEDKPDGVCGPETITAIEKFQKDNPPLKVDGLYGPLTHAKMKEVLEGEAEEEKNKDNEVEWRLNKIKELEAQLKPAEAGPDGEIDAQANAAIHSQIKALKQQIAILQGAKLQTIDQTLRADIDKNIERFDAEIAKLSKLIFKLQGELDAAEQAGDEDEAEALQNRISNLSKKLANQQIFKSDYEENQKKLKPPEPAPTPDAPVTPSGKTKKVKITKKKTVPAKKKEKPMPLGSPGTYLQQVLKQHPAGTNLVGKSADIYTGGYGDERYKVKIGFTGDGMTLNGKLFKFYSSKALTFGRPLTVKQIVINKSGKSVKMTMSFAGKQASAVFSDAKMTTVLEKLQTTGQHVESVGKDGTITIKP